MYSLASINDLIADTNPINAALQASSAVLIRAAYDHLSKLYNWRGAADELTDAERDTIEAMIGSLYADLTTEVSVAHLVGEIIMTVTTQSYTPPKCLLCDGAQYLRSDYPDLVAVISTGLYDADGIHFYAPEMRGRFPRGQGTGPGLSAFSTNQKGGAETHAISIAELPAHHHTMRRYNSASGALPGQVTTLDSTMSSPQDTAPDTGDTGSGTPMSILPPQYGVRFWIVALP